MKKLGIITFHASHNCGSMLQAYALQCFLKKNGYDPEIINFSSNGQQRIYSLFVENNSVKNLIKNCIIFLHKSRIKNNFNKYEEFKSKNFKLTDYFTSNSEEIVDKYDAVVAGADQIWNVTISDFDKAYFLSWVDNAKKIAYAPSFGAKNVMTCMDDPTIIKKYLDDFDSISIREKNGQKWIKELTGKDVPVVLDPTLLVEKADYEIITSNDLKLPSKYIFYYSPSYSKKINDLVNKISKRYKLPVIAFNSKSFYFKMMNFHGFKLPDFEDPSAYLQLMKNAEMVITTSYHGTIFSSIYRKNFWVIKNGQMFGDDDRVATLIDQLSI